MNNETIVLTGSTKPKNYVIFLILAYLWALIATPQNRFPFLGEIRFEMIVVLASWALLLLSGKIQIRSTAIIALLVIFFCWMMIGYFLSPYQDIYYARIWYENYWKMLVLYFLLLFAINDLDALFYICAGLVVISLLYQLHSWYDFLNGSSYVWQQGMARIVGVWSRRTLGGPNSFAFLALFSLPFGLLWFNATNRKSIKGLLLFFFTLCCASILFSGTRAALVVLLFMVVWVYTCYRFGYHQA